MGQFFKINQLATGVVLLENGYILLRSIIAYLKIGMNMICVPVKGIILHLEVVTWKVSGRVAQIVVLIPEDSLSSRRRRDDLGADGQADVGDPR